MTPLLRRRLLLSAWILCLSVGIAVLARLGPPAGAPSLRTLVGSGVSGPVGGPSDPIDVVVSISRVVGLAILSYLLLATVLQLLASRRGSTRIAGAARRMTPRFLLAMTAGVIVSSGTAFAATGPGPGVVAPGAAGSASGRAAEVPTMEVPRMEVIADEATPDSAQVPPDGSLTSLPWAVGTASGPTPEPAEPIGTPAAPDVSQLPESIALYTVQPGDHLWSIAEQEVTLRVGAGVTDARVATYWSALIDANRDRLVDPDNTDLILPGQVLVLPF